MRTDRRKDGHDEALFAILRTRLKSLFRNKKAAQNVVRRIRTDDNAIRALITNGLQLHTRSTRAYLPDSVPNFSALCTDGRRAAYHLT